MNEYKYSELRRLKPRVEKVKEPTETSVVERLGMNLLRRKLIEDNWVIFIPEPDTGTDLIAGKNWATLQIQVKTSTLGEDNRYSFTLNPFREDPRFFIVYCHLHDIRSKEHEFYIIPSMEIWNIPRFKKALKTPTFRERKVYTDKLKREKAEKELKKYLNNWKQLEELTEWPRLFKALEEFHNSGKWKQSTLSKLK